MMIFKYILLHETGERLTNTVMPCLLNIGVEFEYEHAAVNHRSIKHPGFKGTFEVKAIHKDKDGFMAYIYCWRIKQEVYKIDHLVKTPFVVMSKSLSI